MFEESSYYRSNARHKSSVKLNQLIARYKVLQKLEELKRDELKHKKYSRKRTLRVISQELKKSLRPEETYEIWHEFKNLNVNIQQHRHGKTDNVNADVLRELAKEDVIASDEEDTETRLVEDKLRSFTTSFDTSNHWVKSNFLIKTNGLEVLPYENYDTVNSVSRHHLKNLETLLHLNVLRKNWHLAYKIFCLLVRTPAVDLRSIWPIGIEILNNCNQSGLKEEKFFSWLSSFYTANKKSVMARTTLRETSAPIWRSGSRSNSPLYIISMLWDLLVKRKHEELRDKLDELLLEPPYNVDGVFYFLKSLCYIAQNIELLNDYRQEYANKLEISSKVQQNIEHVRTNLLKSEELSFAYPKEIIEEQISVILREIQSNESNNSSDDDVDENLEEVSDNQQVDLNDWGDISDDEDDMLEDFEDARQEVATSDIETSNFDNPQTEVTDNTNTEYDISVSKRNQLDFEFDFE